MSGRVVFWYSHGAASTVAIIKGLEKLKKENDSREIVIAYCHVKDEHPDSIRYCKEVEKVIGRPIKFLINEKYQGSVDEVIKKTRYMAGVRGARCTAELKKQVRREFEEPDDLNVFGFHVGEEHRLDNLIDSEPLGEFWAPLIEEGITKQECLDYVSSLGIEIPKMYQMGYNNNNCIGCLKASGAGYWNKIRNDFPDVFYKRAEQERLINVALTKVSVGTLLGFPSEVSKILLDISHNKLKEIKIEGKGKPVFNNKNKKYEHCVFIPYDLAVEYGIDECCNSEIIEPGFLNSIKNKTLAVNTYELFNDFSNEFSLIFIDGKNEKIKAKGSTVRIPLRYLPKDMGDHKTEHSWECGIFCQADNESSESKLNF